MGDNELVGDMGISLESFDKDKSSARSVEKLKNKLKEVSDFFNHLGKFTHSEIRDAALKMGEWKDDCEDISEHSDLWKDMCHNAYLFLDWAETGRTSPPTAFREIWERYNECDRQHNRILKKGMSKSTMGKIKSGLEDKLLTSDRLKRLGEKRQEKRKAKFDVFSEVSKKYRAVWEDTLEE